ncbi:MAG: endolytic transglycosylase MltG [bacterium]|nr:endolytic transglycosylase MltG [bacterium]
MQPLEHALEKMFDVGHRALQHLSESWRLHTNRRTIIILIVAGFSLASLYIFAIEPPENFPVDKLVEVPAGASLKDIAKTLEAQGVVRSGLMLRMLLKLSGDERTAHAGDYLFKEPRDIFRVARALALGAYGLEPMRIRVPEGAMMKDMALVFGRQLERFDTANFLAQAQPQEGYFFPDTYFFLPNATEDTVIQAMRQNFDTHIATITPQIASSTHSLSDIVKMASILELEARNTKDRRTIAGVLWNRLERGMPLQVDVTFLYTIGRGTFQLTVKDLTSDSPYNTYNSEGLPPTPIGSPSLDSLLAAAQPIKSDYIYFLADRRGVTHYCKTYSCHIANKARYF